MGIFSKKEKSSPPVFSNPIVTYNITHLLDGRLVVTPNSSIYNTYNILLDKPKTFRESIEISIVHANGAGHSAAQHGGVVGHCVTQVYTGKFQDFSVSNRNFDFRHSGHGGSSKYSLKMGGKPLKDVKWVDDSLSGSKKPDGRLKLEDGNENVLARFAGAGGGGSEFALLEIYHQGQAAVDVGVDWCGLVILTAVSAYLREERLREEEGKSKGRAGALRSVGEVCSALAGLC